MMCTKGVVLGHHISTAVIKVDLTNIAVIVNLPSPSTQKDVRSFIGYARYYR